MKSKAFRPASEQLEGRALMAVFQVTSAANAGPGSLRAAIFQANANVGVDTISFQLPSDDTAIRLRQILPAISGQVIIDGYTQAGAARNTSTDPAVNNAKIPVQIIANGMTEAPILVINPRGSGSQIRGISFESEVYGSLGGITINQASRVTVDGNAFVANGQARLSTAIRINGGERNTIGGDSSADPALQNVMTHYTTAVDVGGGSRYNAIVGNRIGGDPYPSRDPFQKLGVWFRSGASNNTLVNNILYKNRVAIRNEGAGNVVEPNSIVPG